ncbi:OsmC family protein [Flavobacterium cerinum]|uniref:Osmotically inducible protein OsmC n=1 Tax=Flavobacterium cerinum TaxID=2502784 RepID=A0A444HG62_9FLAO|nr:OsmC family protein [Flavobacterium cerinum]RWX03899.1 osmotically inducible protein OsmC [Flavobacterium cerinum]
MGFKHLFKAKAFWSSEKKNKNIKSYSRSHTIVIEGKPVLNVSAAKAFKGDPLLYNPEDMLLGSLVSCHMMSYLYVCAQNGIEVLAYSDDAVATLEVALDGSGRFTEVVLNPKVIIADIERKEEALALHKKANQLCFIANSCNFPILHNPSCETA